VQALYACLARALSSALGGSALGALREPSYRLYNCRRCGVQVRVCGGCDHGNIYCAGPCAQIRRRESLRRAAVRYQRSRRGAGYHAARQQVWRTRRRQKVTHQGCASAALCRSVSATPIMAVDRTDAQCAETANSMPHRAASLARCAFCRAPLPAWTRLRRWSWSG
jgi:hypothetical protein